MRSVNRVLAAIIGLVLLAGGVLVAIEIALAFVGSDPWVVPYRDWYRTARSDPWTADAVRGICITLALLGLAVVLLQLARLRPHALPLKSTEFTTYCVRRRSLEHSVQRTVEHVDGIHDAKVRVDHDAVRVIARSHRQLAGDLQPRVETAVRSRLDQLAFETRPSVRIKISTRKERT